MQQLLLETTTSLTGVGASSDEIIDSAAVRSYLHGVVVGPHWSVPTSKIVKDMPEGYAVRQYPDVRRQTAFCRLLFACVSLTLLPRRTDLPLSVGAVRHP